MYRSIILPKQSVLLLVLLTAFLTIKAQSVEIPFGNGSLRLTPMADNAVRIQYAEEQRLTLPEWVYLPTCKPVGFDSQTTADGKLLLTTSQMSVEVDAGKGVVAMRNSDEDVVFRATAHELTPANVAGTEAYEAQLVTDSPEDEVIFGLGQFQDGYANVRGLTRRLTQVNTQIALPMYLSNKGYGLLWNNYGLTDFNPADRKVVLQKASGEEAQREVVNVTSSEGNKQEIRERNLFTATIEIEEAGEYSFLLDVGQKMARRHQLSIDGQELVSMKNLWLPPTTSVLYRLEAGRHQVSAELEKDDRPVLYYKKTDCHTTLRSPVAAAVDYTLFVGRADDVVKSYRAMTGNVPLMPRWALGYIHCRERFHSQEELLQTARQFRQEGWPVDVMVQVKPRMGEQSQTVCYDGKEKSMIIPDKQIKQTKE